MSQRLILILLGVAAATHAANWPEHPQLRGEAPDAAPANKKARDDAWTRWKSLLKAL